MNASGRFAVTLAVILTLASRAAADPTEPCTTGVPCHLRMREPTTLIKDSGDAYRLPPGRFLDEITFESLDDEFKRLQDQETRLTAENTSFRHSLDSWRPGWITLVTAVVVGVAGGVGGYYWYVHH